MAWRDRLQPAFFRNTAEALFHVEVGGKENGRRVVVHQFPKKELPYAEDMGRRAISFNVRGYCIQYPRDAGGLYVTDYTRPRDALIAQLEMEGPGTLRLPLLPPMRVMCQRYRVTEERERGGYCAFDMQFVELGAPPGQESTDARSNLISASNNMIGQAAASLQSAGHR